MAIRYAVYNWLPRDAGYPVANDKNIKMLLDDLRKVYIEREPLTITELSHLYGELEDKTILNICRAIEQAHGIEFDKYVDDKNRHLYEIQEA